jgi:F-box domain
MPSIPLDVLLEILEHVDKNDLATLCRVNKICCACSQDVLYREIKDGGADVIQTLAHSTDLARRVRSFETTCSSPELATALRNMSSLRSLEFDYNGDEATSILDGCTFKLESFSCQFAYRFSLENFFIYQPNLTDVKICDIFDYSSVSYPFEETCLPNLTRVMANPSLLRILIPGRLVKEVITFSPPNIDSTDLSFFTLSTIPIQKLWIDFDMLYPKPGSLLVSIFPSLVHLMVYARNVEWTVRVPLSI